MQPRQCLRKLQKANGNKSTFDLRLVRPWEVTGWSISLISVDMSSWLSLSRAGLFDFLDFCPSDLVRCFCKTHCNQNFQIMACTAQVKYLINSDDHNWKPTLPIRSQINQTYVANSGHLPVCWCRLIRGIIGALWAGMGPFKNGICICIEFAFTFANFHEIENARKP